MVKNSALDNRKFNISQTLLRYMRYMYIMALTMLMLNANADSNTPISKSYLNDVAIGGHDTTAYFSSAKALQGDKAFEVIYQDAVWRFSNQAQADEFKNNPQKYSPAYGGYCSNALALGEGLIKTQGDIWYIFNDKLHLFYAQRGLDRWLAEDYAQLKAQADANWNQMVNQ